jgi:hypothetical protein
LDELSERYARRVVSRRFHLKYVASGIWTWSDCNERLFPFVNKSRKSNVVDEAVFLTSRNNCKDSKVRMKRKKVSIYVY